MSDSSMLFHKMGRVEVSIDFSQQIHGFRSHVCPSDHYIYQSEDCMIFSPNEPMKPGFYTARDILVSTIRHPDGILLEDYAYQWITSPERDIRIFESKDFLEQVCITHSIWRIRERNDSTLPVKDFQEEEVKEDRKVQDALLRMFEPKIDEAAKIFIRRNPTIEYGEAYTQAYILSSLILLGENRNIIQEIRSYQNKNPKDKQGARKLQREHRLHPLRTHKGRKNLDIEKIESGALEEILKHTASTPGGIEMFLLMMQPEAFSGLISESLNYNSDRVYKPWFEENIIDHIFGKKGKSYSLVSKFLRDTFKTEVKHRRTQGPSIGDDISIEDVDNQPYSRRQWKSYRNYNHISSLERERIEKIAAEHLSKKEFEAYSSWLGGSYDSRDAKVRQNLKRAKDKLQELNFGLPLPKSQRR